MCAPNFSMCVVDILVELLVTNLPYCIRFNTRTTLLASKSTLAVPHYLIGTINREEENRLLSAKCGAITN